MTVSVGRLSALAWSHIPRTLLLGQQGMLIVLSGQTGCGKTTMLNHLRKQLHTAGDKERISLNTLILALFYDLPAAKDSRIQGQ